MKKQTFSTSKLLILSLSGKEQQVTMKLYYHLLIILFAFLFSTIEAQQTYPKKYYKRMKDAVLKYDGDYRKLDTIKTYSFHSSYSYNNGKPIHMINNKVVSFQVYNKFQNEHKKIADCKPCILKLYNVDDVILSEMVAYYSTPIDWVKTYHLNNKIKSTEQFIFSDSIFNEKILFITPFVMDGESKFYDTLGNYTYSEFWNKGTFIKQVPLQSFNEAIKSKLFLDKNELNDNTLLAYSDLNQLSIDVTRKNNAIDTSTIYLDVFFGINKRVHFHSYQTGITTNHLPFDSLKYIDFKEKVRQSNHFLSTDSIRGSISVYNAEKLLEYKSFNVRNELTQSDDSITAYKQEQIRIEHSAPTKTNQLSFSLVNSKDSTKVVRIKDGYNIEITYEELVNDSLIQEKRNTARGELLAITDTTISFRIDQEDVYTKFKNGSNIEQQTSYYNDDYSTLNSVKRTINKNQLKYFQYDNKARNAIQVCGSTLTIVSVGTALLVAPLVSINYKNGNFNKEKYYTVAGCGLAGIAVGIPLIIIGQQKYYSITTRSKAKKSDAWYISE